MSEATVGEYSISINRDLTLCLTQRWPVNTGLKEILKDGSFKNLEFWTIRNFSNENCGLCTHCFPIWLTGTMVKAMQFYDRDACKALVSNRKVFLDRWSRNSLVQGFVLPFTRRCVGNLKEKARSGSLSGNFDARIKANTFIQTNVLVLPGVYLSLWIRILQTSGIKY